MEAAIVLGTIVTIGNTHDSHILEPLVGQVIEKVGKPEAAAADAAYKTPAITSYLFGHKITPALPYSRPRTKEGFFCKHDYVYDEHFDCYLCPSDEILKYSTMNKEGYLEYKSPKHICVNCPFLSKCTESKDHERTLPCPIGHLLYIHGREFQRGSECFNSEPLLSTN